MRTSAYNIIVNVDDGVYAIINSYTHAFDLINEDVCKYLKNENEGSISDNAINKLIKRGYLTSLNKEEEKILIKRITDNVHERNKLKTYNFQFIMSYDCNFRCTYCFENEILNTVKCPSKETISKDFIDKAFDVIYENAEKKKCNSNITLYGGEPFLLKNREQILYIVEKGRKYNFKFSAPTNGYDLDSYFDFFKENPQLFCLQITLDGIKDIHNNNRPHFIHDDSFDKISNNIDMLLKIGVFIKLRINTDSKSLKRSEELLHFFEERGWNKYKNFSGYFALLREEVESRISLPVDQEQKIINQLDLVKNIESIKKMPNNIKCQDFEASKIINELIKGKKVPYKGYFCGAQINNILFDPLGDIYPCWDVVGQKEHRIGKYVPHFQLYDDHANKWFDNKISNYNCIKCKYVLFCGGGCVIRRLNETGEVQPGYCNHFPQIFNHAVRTIYDTSLKNNYEQI